MLVMRALYRFVNWLATYTFVDRNNKLPADLKLQYHSRSDKHSKILGEFIVDDLLDTCQVLRDQAAKGEVAFAINHTFTWPNGKAKTIDLALGIPTVPKSPPVGIRIHRLKGQSKRPEDTFSRLLIACEEKAVMTEHGKSQPRIYSELNDSHTIVHNGDHDTIAAGITVVNVASSFISPLRQRLDKPVEVTDHDQPHVTERMVNHLRKLPIRTSHDSVGLEAYCTFVVDLDNQGRVQLHATLPAPQLGDSDHYQTFLARICQVYSERFVDLQHAKQSPPLTFDQQLVRLSTSYPGLLKSVGELAVSHGLAGAERLQSILEGIGEQANRRDTSERA